MHLIISIVFLIFGYYHVQAAVAYPAFMGYGYQMPEYQMQEFQTQNTFYTVKEPLLEFLTCPEQRAYQHLKYSSPETLNMNIIESPLSGCNYPLAGTGYPPFTINGDEPTRVPGCGKYLRQVTVQPPYL